MAKLQKEAVASKTKISVYMNFGVVFEYEVDSAEKAREHAAKIIATGYRHTQKNSQDLEWYPPHAIEKIKIAGAAESTAYRDLARAT